MVAGVIIGVLAGCLFVLAWYVGFSRYNRRRARVVVRWIERAFHGHAQVASVEWAAASRLRAQMRVAASMFRQAAAVVQFLPRELPVSWLLSRLRRQRETFTFEADLDVAPAFNLEVHNHRWYGRTRRRLAGDTAQWSLEQAGRFVLTTRNDWQREITCMTGALAASRECDCLTVCFRRSSPHFSVTVPLDALAPNSETQAEIFDVLRELAAGASTARF